MKFGEKLKKAIVPRWSAFYCNYDFLKDQLAKISTAEKPSEVESIFASNIQHELKKVSDFATATFTQVKVSAADLLRKIGKMRNAAQRLTMCHILQELAKSVVDLEAFIHLNATAFRKISKKFDKVVKRGTQSFLMAQVMQQDFLTRVDCSQLLPALSYCFSLMREAASEYDNNDVVSVTDRGSKGEVWCPPDSFERQTTKYWVRSENTLLLQMKILEYLPLLIWGGADIGKAILQSETDLIGVDEALLTSNSGAQEITSVYMDSAKLDLYHGRLRRDEGAKLVRCRWYGAQPAPSETVFMERKVHHESWVQEQSVKERFQLPFGQVCNYLEGSYDPVLTGDRSQAVADDVRRLSKGLKLQPMVRTSYQRTAFQLQTSNAVRITVDKNLVLQDDAPIPGKMYVASNDASDDQKPNGAQPVDWTLRDTDQTSRGKYDFPFTILEIKLSGEVPSWLKNLLDTGLLVEVKKFSKYLTGGALLHAPAIKALPHWFEENGAISTESMEFLCANTSETEAVDASSQIEGAGVFVKRTWLKPDMITLETSASDSDEITSRIPEKVSPKIESQVIVGTGNIEMSLRAPSCDRQVPAAYSAVARSQNDANDKDVSDGRMLAPSIARVIHGMHVCMGCNETDRNSPLPPRMVPIKIEPKTFFANERTFIQWLSISVLIVTLSMALTSFEDPARRTIGIILFPVSVLFLIYALIIFQWRAKSLREKRNGPYDDRFGPIVMVIAVLVALVANMVYALYPEEYQYSLSSQTLIASQNCEPVLLGEGLRLNARSEFDRSVDRINAFESPSGIALVNTSSYSERATIFIATDYHLLRAELDGTGHSELVGNLNFGGNYDIEGLAFDREENRLLMVAEKPTNSILSYDLDNSRLRVTSLESLLGSQTDSFEGIAVDNSTGLIWVSSTTSVFAIRWNETVQAYNRVKKKKLMASCDRCGKLSKAQKSADLAGGGTFKIGDIEIFENYLFVLFDNAYTLVVFDIETGKKHAEHALPGGSKGWEGFTVIRRSSAATISVLLAMDYPPQVWQLTYNFGNGFHNC